MKIQNTKQELDIYSKSKSEESAEENVLGVEGQYKWPVRIISFLVFAAAVAVNYLVGLETGEVSDKYRLYVTPPGLFFSIWIVIFSTMALANIYNLIRNVWSLPAHIYLGINNILLIVWINIFNIGNDAAVYSCFFILTLTVVIALKFWIQLGKVQQFTPFTYIARNVYAFYLGWIIAASNLNFGILMVYWWKASFETQLIAFWVIAPLCAIGATVFNGYRQGKKGILSCFCLWISVIWAFTGAAISSNTCLSDPDSC